MSNLTKDLYFNTFELGTIDKVADAATSRGATVVIHEPYAQRIRVTITEASAQIADSDYRVVLGPGTWRVVNGAGDTVSVSTFPQADRQLIRDTVRTLCADHGIADMSMIHG